MTRAAAAMVLVSTLFWGCADDAPTVLVSVSGSAFHFGPEGGRVEGALVTILEMPEQEAVTDGEGGFLFEDLPSGSSVSLVMHHESYAPIQTGTFVLGEEDITRVSFQAPPHNVYQLMAMSAGVRASDDRCQIATTLTRMGNSLYDETPGTHGEPHATATIDPPLGSGGVGPVYFNIDEVLDAIYPDPELSETTHDGGVLFLEAEPGTYTLRAQKEGAEFSEVLITCREGMLVNASPPWGLQVTSGGIGPRQD